MKFETLTLAELKRVVGVYLSVAWPGSEEEREPDWGEDRSGEELLPLFADESNEEGDQLTRRYVMRLGNQRYPHMKLVFHEYLIPNEFVFSVDTHDQLELKPNYPDYEAWQALREFNRDLQGRIEERWRAEEIPTHAALKELVEEGRAGRAAAPRGGKILVVDDEREIADTVASLLIAEGYDVLIAHDGQEAVDTALVDRPDLILMDFQMPRMDGVTAAQRIRRTLGKGTCRILLATAALIDLSAISEADGFLLKPYQRDILLPFIHALLDQ